MNVCTIGNVCAEANKTAGEGGHGVGGTVYGCGPPDVTDGLDSRICTSPPPTATQMMRTLSTTTSQAEGSSRPTQSSAAPIGNGGNRLAVPIVLRGMVALVQGVTAISLPSPVRPECCGDICCPQGEVCTRSSEGGKCWSADSRRGIAGPEETRTEQDDTVHVAELPSQAGNPQDKKGGGGGGHGGHA